MVRRTRRDAVGTVTETVEDVVLVSPAIWIAEKYSVISRAKISARQWNDTET